MAYQLYLNQIYASKKQLLDGAAVAAAVGAPTPGEHRQVNDLAFAMLTLT